MDASLAPLRDRIVAANASETPLRFRGAGTKDFFGESFDGEMLDTRPHRGIVAYEPTELVITARCGTPFSEIDAALDQNDQFLPFEAPRFNGDPTIGGIIAAGLSGPRRAASGAVRDFVLGAHLLNANGDELRFGGQVMKNVAGFDVSRLLCGSLGILGLITQVSLKVLPKPRAETTLRFEMTAIDALARFNVWRGQPLPIVATAWSDGIAHVKLAGAPSAIKAAKATLGGDVVADDTDLWRSLRDQTHSAFAAPRLWRLSLPATATFLLPGIALIEWSGAQRWLASDAPSADIRDAAASVGGSATLWRGERDTSMFHPLKPANLELHRRLKHNFDPNRILNRGRLVAEL
ncbi:MAG TPA: glycolate oxidase subunit GlcE [Rudaea sp.]|jgi:glycolate oxidase FAD binding subunit|nr:glycolate oxidase subunit GlcE [Rudaea sp.]